MADLRQQRFVVVTLREVARVLHCSRRVSEPEEHARLLGRRLGKSTAVFALLTMDFATSRAMCACRISEEVVAYRLLRDLETSLALVEVPCLRIVVDGLAVHRVALVARSDPANDCDPHPARTSVTSARDR